MLCYVCRSHGRRKGRNDDMWSKVIEGILIPLLGTSLGAACVFFLPKGISRNLSRALSGFAGGIMISASFFSLIQPALEQSAALGPWAFLPGAVRCRHVL